MLKLGEQEDGDVWNRIVFKYLGKNYVTKFKSRRQEGDNMNVEVEAVPTQYPHAEKYIRGLSECNEETKKTYEFEAHICDVVEDAVGSWECQHCHGRRFKLGDVVVDFTVPFVHGSRIQVGSLKSLRAPWEEDFVQCLGCHRNYSLKAEL